VVLSDALWRGRLNADPGLIGRSISINQHHSLSSALGSAFEPSRSLARRTSGSTAASWSTSCRPPPSRRAPRHRCGRTAHTRANLGHGESLQQVGSESARLLAFRARPVLWDHGAIAGFGRRFGSADDISLH
jgi:hypothetical protein